MQIPTVVSQQFQQYKQNLSFGSQEINQPLKVDAAVDHFVALEQRLNVLTSLDQSHKDLSHWEKQVKISPDFLTEVDPQSHLVEAEFLGDRNNAHTVMIHKEAAKSSTYEWVGYLADWNRQLDLKATLTPEGVSFEATSMNFQGYIANVSTLELPWQSPLAKGNLPG